MQSGEKIKVFSTFVSINGEVCQYHQGSLCTFVRLAGCNLRCTWCDTEYAQKAGSGTEIPVAELVTRIKRYGHRKVTITGGEPFMQEKALYELLEDLTRLGFLVSVETNGSYTFLPFDDVSYVVDYKMPSSGESDKMKLYTPWMELKPTDWIKFVIADQQDFFYAREVIRMLRDSGCHAQIAMSPILTNVSGTNLLQWFKNDNMKNVVISVQLHKLMNLNEPK